MKKVSIISDRFLKKAIFKCQGFALIAKEENIRNDTLKDIGRTRAEKGLILSTKLPHKFSLHYFKAL